MSIRRRRVRRVSERTKNMPKGRVMQKITTFLWFDGQAEEAAVF